MQYNGYNKVYKCCLAINAYRQREGMVRKMTGEERRNELLNTIKTSSAPISGTALARKYQVSRQVIVQDIALLRAAHHEVYSTPKGYMYMPAYADGQNEEAESVQTKKTSKAGVVSRVYRVSHTDDQIEDELNTIVDMGGNVLDVFVEHEVYGSIRADLPVHCRRHVQEFMEEIRTGKSKPLKNLSSGGIHYHTVEADSENTLDLIEKKLEEKGYLVR